MAAEPASRGGDNGPPVRSVLRVVITVVCSFLALYLLYLLRGPIGWIALAAFLAVAASGPLPSLIAATIKVGIEGWGAHRERHAALPEPDPSG